MFCIDGSYEDEDGDDSIDDEDDACDDDDYLAADDGLVLGLVCQHGSLDTVPDSVHVRENCLEPGAAVVREH